MSGNAKFVRGKLDAVKKRSNALPTPLPSQDTPLAGSGMPSPTPTDSIRLLMPMGPEEVLVEKPKERKRSNILGVLTAC